ncbi:MAG: YrhB domain-containing protein [Pseudomonadota bacterium]
MLMRSEARAIVVRRVAAVALDLPPGDALVLVDESTIERPWGWVFFYTSRLWHATQEFQYAIAGNAPFLIERATGRVHELGTALAVENYIAAYERTGDPHAD